MLDVTVPLLDPRNFGHGVYRRRIEIERSGSDRVVAELEDDYHHFRATLVHDGARVVAFHGEAVRFPWSTCPGATAALDVLVGMPLSPRCSAVGEHADVRRQCTHLFDLAGLAVAHAATGRDRRQYDVTAPDPSGPRRESWLARDGEEVLRLTLEAGTIVAPARYTGRSLTGGFLAWAESSFEPDEAEALIVLRRGTMIGAGRGTDMDGATHAIDIGAQMLGSCHTFTVGIAETAARMRHTTLDFTDAPDELLSGNGH